MARNRQTGFTLYELMITVSVIGVVLAFGIPNLMEFGRNNRMAAATNDLLGAFSLARTEAIKQRLRVTVCSSADPTANDPACGGTLADGAIVFVDINGDAAHDAGERVLRRIEGPPNTINVVTNPGANYFTYERTGLSAGNVAGVPLQGVLLCDQRGNVTDGAFSAARALSISATGRPQVVRETARITDVINNVIGAGCP